jgi:hypothetical protein
MGRPAIDPDRPNNVALATKLPPADASWLTQIAEARKITRSEVIRRIVQERIRREQEPPDDGGGQSTTPDNDPG